MPRNPFTTSKKRKRKPKRVVVKQEPGVPKPFCPRSMVRYDRCHTLQNMTMWTCKRCMTCLLSETAAREHIISCKTPKPPPKPSTSFAEKCTEMSHYVCKYCDQVFSRQVTLKRHVEQHETSPQDLDSDEEEPSVPFRRPAISLRNEVEFNYDTNSSDDNDYYDGGDDDDDDYDDDVIICN